MQEHPGIGIAVVTRAGAVLAGVESVRKLIDGGSTDHLGWGMAGAVIGIFGNQAVARYQLVVGRRIHSGTLVADAEHSWLNALSSAGALLGLIGVAAERSVGDAEAVGRAVGEGVARDLPDVRSFVWLARPV